jgi:hypothetical protein
VTAAGADVLLEATTPSGPLPVVAAQRYGQGRVVAVLTDSLWRWQLEPSTAASKPYERFWSQLVAWLMPAGEEVRENRLDLFADRDTLHLGEQVELSARLGTAGGDGRGSVRCEVESPDGRRLPFLMAAQPIVTPSGGAFAGYAVRYAAQTPGLHKATASVELDGTRVQSDPATFFVKPFTPESVPRAAGVDVLAALSRASGGAFCETVAELNAVLAGLHPRPTEERTVTHRSLWQTAAILACLLALLSIEWTLRKWRNMP